jgi:hypothetical protein
MFRIIHSFVRGRQNLLMLNGPMQDFLREMLKFCIVYETINALSDGVCSL